MIVIIQSHADKIPDKLPDPGRLQLIEMSVTEPQEVAPSQEGSSSNIVAKEAPPPEGDDKEKNTTNGGKVEQIKLYVTKLSKKPPCPHFFLLIQFFLL